MRGKPHPRQRGQRGAFLIELSIALLISAVLAIYGSTRITQEADDATASATGVYLDTLASAAQRYILNSFLAIGDGTDVAGVANDLAPTITELAALGRLPSAYPGLAPTRQAPIINIIRTNCPGPNCQLTAVACLSSGMTVRGRVREDLATQAMVAMQGRGGRSHADTPGIVRGPSMSVANPAGAVNAVVCGQTIVDAGLYDSLVRINDRRDPGLTGGLTVSGLNATGETLRANGNIAVVDPATGTVCVQILTAGTININCQGRLNATTGTFTGPQGTVRVGSTGTTFLVDTAGRIKADAGFWTAVGSVFGDNTLGIRAANTTFTIQTSAAQDALAVHDSGRTGSRTSVSTPVIGLTDPVTAGQACTSAATQVAATQVTLAATSALRALAGGGLAICDSASGTWVAVTRSAVVGSACDQAGATALTGLGVMLVCSNGVWTTLLDRMGYMVAAESWRVSDGNQVPKPDCAPGSTGSRLLASPGNEAQNVQFVNRYITDNGATWTVRMVTGSGSSVDGDMVVLSYCTY
jgi:hypothetical protein